MMKLSTATWSGFPLKVFLEKVRGNSGFFQRDAGHISRWWNVSWKWAPCLMWLFFGKTATCLSNRNQLLESRQGCFYNNWINRVETCLPGRRQWCYFDPQTNPEWSHQFKKPTFLAETLVVPVLPLPSSVSPQVGLAAMAAVAKCTFQTKWNQLKCETSGSSQLSRGDRWRHPDSSGWNLQPWRRIEE